MKRRHKIKKRRAPSSLKREIAPPREHYCKLSTCEDRLIKELIKVWQQDNQDWAIHMKVFLEFLNSVIVDTGGTLGVTRGKKYRSQYRKLHKMGRIEIIEPTQLLHGSNGKRCKKSRSLYLLDELDKYEDYLFMFPGEGP